MKTIQSHFEVELFDKKSDWVIFIAICWLIFCISLFMEYSNYKEIRENKTISLNAKVLLQYKKIDKNYYVLKLKGENGGTFYTTSRDDLKDLRGRYINIYGTLGKDCGFKEYLKSCFVVSYAISLLNKKDFRSGIIDYIDSQHSNKFSDKFDEFSSNLASKMYQGLFLATPMPQNLRDSANALNIAHIFAISGFHLGILAFVIYFILSPFYKYFQRRYFTYRNEFYDLQFIILSFSFVYLNVISFSPSFLRSFVMFAFSFFVLYRGLKLLSFKLLFACILLILSLFPRVFFSIGFWLSVSGIFYIYLFLKYIHIKNKLAYILLLNIIIFLNMFLISHYTFYSFSLWAVLSPLITLAFVIFYPLVLVLHIIGFGGIFDSFIFFVANYDFAIVETKTPFWLLVIFICISFMAIFNKFAYYFIVFLSFLYFLYGISRGIL